MEFVTLNSGYKMPRLGFGTWTLDDDKAEACVYHALKVGYRLIDTARYYGKEVGVGKGIRRAIQDGIATREEIFVTSKIMPGNYNAPDAAIDASIRALNIGYVDLMLIHWPVGNPTVMWHTLEELYHQGVFKAIGVSNFYPNTFPKIVDDAEVMPVVNQCECHVLFQQRKMLEYMKPYGTVLEAWSPLAEGRSGIVRSPVLRRIGEKYGKSSAQIALKFLIQNGIIIIPKTTHKERMQENISLFDFTLSDDDIREIRLLDTGRNVTGWPSDVLRYEI